MRNTFKSLFIAFFLLMIAMPFLQSVFHFFKQEELISENRALSKKPVLSKETLELYPEQFNSYYNDHFPFRQALTKLYFKASLFMRKSPIKNIIMGKNHFLFSGDVEAQLFQGLYDFHQEDRIATADELLFRYNYLKERGIAFYVLISPTALEVYPEFLPAYLQRSKKTDTDLFCELMWEKYPEVPVLYFKNELLEKKSEGLLYYKNDNHWNLRGGYYANAAMTDRIREDFAQIPNYAWSDFAMDSTLNLEGNLINQVNISDYTSVFEEEVHYNNIRLKLNNRHCTELPKNNYPITPGFAYPWEYEMRFSSEDTTLPDVVFIRDSYCGAIRDFTCFYFNKSVFIFDAWQYGRNFDIIEKEQPDIVILEIYEPHIRNLIRQLRKE